MTESDQTIFSDEEIYKELESLGITDVTPEMFHKMKQDLMEMVSSDIPDLDTSNGEVQNSSISETDTLSFNSLKRSLFQNNSSSDNSLAKRYQEDLRRSVPKNRRYISKSSQKYSSSDISVSSHDLLSSTPNLPNIYENCNEYPMEHKSKSFLDEKGFGDSFKLLSIKENRLGNNSLPSSARSRFSHKSLPQLSSHSQNNELLSTKSPKANIAKSDRFPEVENLGDTSENDKLENNSSPKQKSLLDDYRKRLLNYKVGNRLRQKMNADDTSPQNESSLNSTIVDGKLKRKILRYKDGKPVVTEELVDIPSIYSSYPSSFNTTNSFSSDLSFKSNSSTGSVVAESPESTPRSNLSNTSKTHAFKPNRKKKSDPVAMYNYYKKFWDNFKPPGEKAHQKLRWAVRDKMLDYSL